MRPPRTFHGGSHSLERDIKVLLPLQIPRVPKTPRHLRSLLDADIQPQPPSRTQWPLAIDPEESELQSRHLRLVKGFLQAL